jgi:50S ribosomal subunit-associated GTPase HflX
MVLNKVDALKDLSVVTFFQSKYDSVVTISALIGQDLEKLKQMMVSFATKGSMEIKLECDVSNGKLLAYIYANSMVIDRRFTDSSVNFHIIIGKSVLSKLYQLGGGHLKVTQLS